MQNTLEHQTYSMPNICVEEFAIKLIGYRKATLVCVWRDKNLCGTNLCVQRLTRIIRINKTRAEICRFTVLLPTRVCQHREVYDSILLRITERVQGPFSSPQSDWGRG